MSTVIYIAIGVSSTSLLACALFLLSIAFDINVIAHNSKFIVMTLHELRRKLP